MKQFGAQRYVKALRTAPDGSVLSSAEKGVLRAIADDFRDDLGFSFCSYERMLQVTGRAPEAELRVQDVSEYERRLANAKRIVRRIVAGLEKKGVLRRHAATFDRGGCQTTNEYEFPGYQPVVDVSRRQQARKTLLKYQRSRIDPTQRKRAAGAVQMVLTVSSPGGPGSPPYPGHTGPPLEHGDDHGNELPISYASSPQCANAEIAMPDNARAKASATASAKATATTSSREAAPVRAESEGCAGIRSGRARRWREPAELAVLTMDGEAAALELEVSRVMRECGFTAGPLANTLRQVLQMRVARAKCSIADAGDVAIRNWHAYCEQAPLMRYTVMPKKFFREGVWLTPQAWPLDGRKLEESGLRHPYLGRRSF